MMKLEPWENRHMLRFSLVYVGSGVLGMLVTLPVILLFRWQGWGGVSSGILFIPWMVGALMLIPTAFHKGVELERSRQKQLQGSAD